MVAETGYNKHVQRSAKGAWVGGHGDRYTDPEVWVSVPVPTTPVICGAKVKGCK